MTFSMKSMVASLVAASAFAFGSAETAEAGHKFNQFLPGLTANQTCGVSPFGTPQCGVTPGLRPYQRVHRVRRHYRPLPPVSHQQHVHAYQIVVEQRWCPPVYRDVTVGFDACGTPIRRSVLVTPGTYKLARYKICPCGEKVFLGWV